MPAIQVKSSSILRHSSSSSITLPSSSSSSSSLINLGDPKEETPVVTHRPAGPAQGHLLDLDDLFGGPSPSTTAATTHEGKESTSLPPRTQPTVDLLADLFSSPAPTPSLSSSSTIEQQNRTTHHLSNVYEKNGLSLDLQLTKPNASDMSISHILCQFTNASTYDVENFLLQAAFPKVYLLSIMKQESRYRYGCFSVCDTVSVFACFKRVSWMTTRDSMIRQIYLSNIYLSISIERMYVVYECIYEIFVNVYTRYS
jgi:hypothetical protein